MTETHAEPGGSGRRGRWVLFAGVATLVVIADQASKAFVDANFREAWTRTAVEGYADPTPVLGEFVRIAKSYNEGGIFGLFGQAAPLLAVASLAVIGFIVVYQARHGGASRFLTLVLGLLLGGAIGNLIDRLRSSNGVVDFIDIGINDMRWWTFNVADMAVSTGAFLLAWVLWGEEREESAAAAARIGEPSEV